MNLGNWFSSQDMKNNNLRRYSLPTKVTRLLAFLKAKPKWFQDFDKQ